MKEREKGGVNCLKSVKIVIGWYKLQLWMWLASLSGEVGKSYVSHIKTGYSIAAHCLNTIIHLEWLQHFLWTNLRSQTIQNESDTN